MHTWQRDRAALTMLSSRLSSLSLAVVAAGCGGSAVAVPELSSFTNVAQTSAAADSARFSLEANVSVPGIDKQLVVQRRGRVRHAGEARRR